MESSILISATSGRVLPLNAGPQQLSETGFLPESAGDEMGLLAREIGLAFVTTVAFLGMHALQSPAIPFGLLCAALIAGLVFTIVQGHRRRVNLLTRAASSAISLVLAGYFLSAATYLLLPLKPSPYLAVLIPLYLVLTYRLLGTDLRMWSWYRSKTMDEPGTREPLR